MTAPWGTERAHHGGAGLWTEFTFVSLRVARGFAQAGLRSQPLRSPVGPGSSPRHPWLPNLCHLSSPPGAPLTPERLHSPRSSIWERGMLCIPPREPESCLLPTQRPQEIN